MGGVHTIRTARSDSSVFWRYVKVFLLGFFITAVALSAVFVHNVAKMLPDPNNLSAFSPSQGTRILDRDGNVLYIASAEQRFVVPINRIPAAMINATVAIEDERFFQHQGVDFRAIARAIFRNITGRGREGASTITQQIARTIYLSRERTFSRKLKEALLASEIERKFSKEEILQVYLNLMYYGAQAYGVQAAARVYFRKDISQCSLPECALLAGLVQRPSALNPYVNEEGAQRRRNIVLRKMEALGHITKQQADAAVACPIKLAYKTRPTTSPMRAPHFVEFVLKTLSDMYPEQDITRSGWIVRTSLDPQLQIAAEEAIVKRLDEAQKRGQRIGQGALCALDASTGEILALVGSRNPSQGGYNRAVQARRSPGSAFKLFVYAAATEAGLAEYDRFTDSRATYVGRNGRPYSPRNYDGRYLGSISLMTAFAKSKNTIAVKIANEIGIDKVIDVATRMGIPARYMQPNLSLALGAVGVSPLEMAAAYAVVAYDGKYLAPTPILEIKDSDGNLLFQHVPKPTQVISEEVALQMQRYTRRVVTSGTATSIYARVPNASGKTGTTNDDRDAWFCGFAGNFACAVWVGNDDYSPMEHVYGGKVCAPIWADVAVKFQKRYAGQNLAKKLQQTDQAETSHPDPSNSQDTSASSEPPLEPADEDDLVTVMICPESGRLASESCPNPEVKVMPAARAPSAVCSKHGSGN